MYTSQEYMWVNFPELPKLRTVMDLDKINYASLALSSLQIALGTFFLVQIILFYRKNRELRARHLRRDQKGCNNGRWTLYANIIYIAYDG